MSGNGSGRGGDLFDGLTKIDNILRDSHATLKEIKEALTNIDPRVVTDNITLREGAPRTSFQIEMSSNVPKGDSEIVTRTIPFDGWVTAYTVGFPDGADQAVGLRLEDNDTGDQFFPNNPEDNYFAANDFTHPFELRFPVEEGQELATVLKNNDPSNDHFINSMVTVSEKMPDEEVATTRGR